MWQAHGHGHFNGWLVVYYCANGGDFFFALPIPRLPGHIAVSIWRAIGENGWWLMGRVPEAPLHKTNRGAVEPRIALWASASAHTGGRRLAPFWPFNIFIYDGMQYLPRDCREWLRHLNEKLILSCCARRRCENRNERWFWWPIADGQWQKERANVLSECLLAPSKETVSLIKYSWSAPKTALIYHPNAINCPVRPVLYGCSLNSLY